MVQLNDIVQYTYGYECDIWCAIYVSISKNWILLAQNELKYFFLELFNYFNVSAPNSSTSSGYSNKIILQLNATKNLITRHCFVIAKFYRALKLFIFFNLVTLDNIEYKNQNQNCSRNINLPFAFMTRIVNASEPHYSKAHRTKKKCIGAMT